ncbi:hypothetical protein AtubIFM55763_008369 [Aspergillus tubingensis]|nr:hypothetical protein AtubIFM55763_008369 [Aspergillus tubingensis]
MSDLQPVSRRRVKTRSFECPGYKRPLKWSSKYEVGKSGNNSAAPKSSEQVLRKTEPIQSVEPNLFDSTVSDGATRPLSVQADVQFTQNETAAESDPFAVERYLGFFKFAK